MAKRRSRLEIMAEILRIAKKGAIKTRIVYKANLNFLILRRYLKELKDNGLIENGENNDGVIRTTEKGMQYLERYSEFAYFLNTEDSKPIGDSLGLMSANWG